MEYPSQVCGVQNITSREKRPKLLLTTTKQCNQSMLTKKGSLLSLSLLSTVMNCEKFLEFTISIHPGSNVTLSKKMMVRELLDLCTVIYNLYQCKYKAYNQKLKLLYHVDLFIPIL